MKRSLTGLATVLIGIAAGNAALAGFFVARSGFEAAIPFIISTLVITLISFLLARGDARRTGTTCQ